MVKNLPANRRRSCRFDPWVGKIPWRRKWQPTPIFLTGKSQGRRNLVGYNPWDCKRVNWATKQQQILLTPAFSVLLFSSFFPFFSLFLFFGNHLPKAKRHNHEPHAAVFTDLHLTAGPLLGWAALPSYNVPWLYPGLFQPCGQPVSNWVCEIHTPTRMPEFWCRSQT